MESLNSLKKQETIEDEVWLIKVDLCHNYKNYFRSCNSDNLTSQFEERRKKKGILSEKEIIIKTLQNIKKL